ncbi:hypothetical protein PWG15_25250 (plasmid) [Ensifer adhaerens]|uniref:hypothetical protein n=1 Tax=Ensifer adhaerens TaxID=106592 RepID=UPI0023AA0B0D|nr:hypothetical protein [Ensifer adhaerens]WDZ81057.1 hypothetical protein PWG15_25250 [Ensifer adhaerens]
MHETEYIERSDAAICVWANMADALGASPSLRAAWNKSSSVELRRTAIDLADVALSAWHAMSLEEQQVCIPYDWGFIATVVRSVEWNPEGNPVATIPYETPRALAAAILSDMSREKAQPSQPAHTFARFGQWLETSNPPADIAALLPDKKGE